MRLVAAQSRFTTEASAEIAKINWWLLVYGTGVVVSLGIFFRKFQNLSRLFRFRAISAEKNLRIIEVPNSNIACTFYRTIFLGDQLTETEKLQILSHELVHVKQKHSLDLLFFEILKIIFWFNPLVYIYQNRMAAVHEFIADASVVKSTPKRSYYEQLLNSAFNTTNISFINQFINQSLIKKRIVMLQKSRSKTTAKLKYLVMIPLVMAMLTYVACSDENSSMNYQEEDSLSQYSYTMNKQEEMSNEKREIHKKYEDFLINNPDYVSWATIEGNQITYSVHSRNEEVPEGYIKLEVSDKYDMYINLPGSTKNANGEEKSETIKYEKGDDIPFAVIEEVPVFPGCEGLETNEERKNCMSQKIQEHVQKEFNTSLGKQLGLTGRNRVIAIFKINSQGQVIDVRSRAPHPALEEEAKRVINSLP
ncbi:blaR1 peptidase M56 [Antarcticibacterium sp. 1MA-6-2]|uniref:M56 family metallopeptidase n=1 Tax=Antarcticibacterium sp. 1MA-6-2 TaxID=2908210 RepID=UPI001F23E957|nr:M56 family metallopeptidase [Antarcticibacterium sp. 1MA-6-2]UJH90779.1 blaR1 peptidase M56 [Antarcticibacterium sp. 1MA-6-2]